MGVDKGIFYEPVDANLVMDYYSVIAKPVCLKEIETRLLSHGYSSAQDFCDDMRLVWSNCMRYNPAGDPFHKLGERHSRYFEGIWSESGLCPREGGGREEPGSKETPVPAPVPVPVPVPEAGGCLSWTTEQEDDLTNKLSELSPEHSAGAF